MAELDRLGLRLAELEGAFCRFADFPDVNEWPAAGAEAAPPDLPDAVRQVREYAEHMRRLAARLPPDPGNDALIPQFKVLPRVISHYDDLGRPARLMEVLERFNRNPGVIQKEWMKTGSFTRDDAREEEERWNRFRVEIVQPLLLWWYEARYGPILRVFHEAREIYDRLRQGRGLLNYQDLLIRAAALLRDKPHVREYFRDRYPFLLVDEFQDTDPVQAEVMLLLTATDPLEREWRKCTPWPGSLFVVGDPKQSIYRFRRADIVTYSEVKEIILRGDGGEVRGLVVQLSANFRTSAPIIEWVNRVFEPAGAGSGSATGAGATPGTGAMPGSGAAPLAGSDPGPAAANPAGRVARPRGKSAAKGAALVSAGTRAPNADAEAAGETAGPMLRFPAAESPESPAYVPLQCGREDGNPGDLAGVHALWVPEEQTNREMVTEYEPDRIARTIRHALDRGLTVTRSRQHAGGDGAGRVSPSDFLIVTWKKERLSTLAASLQRYGIPHQVTGGSSLNELDGLKLLHVCLLALARPDDPVALVGALRSELFGFSDADLYAFKRGGGSFSFYSEVPEVLSSGGEGLAEALRDAFARLRDYREWLGGLPVLAAVERIVGDLGLMALAAARPGGDVEAGGLGKALEILRGVERETWSPAQVVECLAGLVNAEETYDGISARSEEKPVVRVMNLHKVKGLEAPVVFLADPYGEFAHAPAIHIDRSGDRVRGFMTVLGEKKGFGQAPVLAQPPGWQVLVEREKRFQAAETLRLRYVAATRAGSSLIITERRKSNGYNPWKHFAEFLAGAPELADPGEQAAPVGEKTVVSDAEVAREIARVEAGVSRAALPGYRLSGVKEYARSLSVGNGPRGGAVRESGGSSSFLPSPPSRRVGEHGLEWGTVIHQLLELALTSPGADLQSVAGTALSEQGLDPGLSAEAEALVRAVTGSSLWKRVLSSPERYTEVPFEMLAAEDGPVPTLLRGQIDLVFRDQDGWVVVDYKTDRVKEGEAAGLLEDYANQVRLYAQAWERCTGEKVREAALYFVREDRLISVIGPAPIPSCPD